MQSFQSEVSSIARKMILSPEKAQTFLKFFLTDDVLEREKFEEAIKNKLGIDDLNQILSKLKSDRTSEEEKIRCAERFLQTCIESKGQRQNSMYDWHVVATSVGLAIDTIGLIHFFTKLNFLIKDEQGNQSVNIQPILETAIFVVLALGLIYHYSKKKKTQEAFKIQLNEKEEEKNPEHKQIPQKKESQDKNGSQEQMKTEEKSQDKNGSQKQIKIGENDLREQI